MYASGASINSVTYNLTWSSWVSEHYGLVQQTASSSARQWISWNSSTTFSGLSQPSRRPALPIPTLELIAQREQQQVEYRAKYEASRLERQAAKERAKRILIQHLNEDQSAQYERDGFFFVIGQSGKLYKIKQGRAQNVFEIGPDGKAVAQLCAHPRDQIPDEDSMLSQLLFLKYREEEFLRIANRTRLN